MAESEMKLVLIEWVDSFGCSTDWVELDMGLCPKPVVCRSVGWLLHDGPECKVIVPHVANVPDDKQKQGCGDMTIPTACVRNVFDVTVDQPPASV